MLACLNLRMQMVLRDVIRPEVPHHLLVRNPFPTVLLAPFIHSSDNFPFLLREWFIDFRNVSMKRPKRANVSSEASLRPTR